MKEFFFDDFIEQIKEFQRHQLEEREKTLAEVITKYDFMVGSKDLKETLKTILPEGANIAYTPYIVDPTSVYAIKKFDMMDYLFEPQESEVKEGMTKCKCDCLFNIDDKCTKQSKEDMTVIGKWKNDFKGFINELSMSKENHNGEIQNVVRE